jgi:orotate phosphoribosyltransferase
MSSVILHISDFHVSLDKKYDGEVKTHDSYLSAVNENDSSLLYLERFIEFVKTQVQSKTIYLLITGDLTDWGEQTEFEFAEKYLEKIIYELKISKTNILLIPGDHDLNRRDIENQLAEKPESSIDEVNDAKFANFKKFYSSFLNKEFRPNSIVFDSLLIENKIQLLGINSSYRIDLQHKDGFISIEKFNEEIKRYLLDENVKNIFCCHHNIVSVHENKKSGQWDINNRARLLSKLQEKSINIVFSGNEHTSSFVKHGQGEVIISDSGPLTSKTNDSAFKIYEIQINEDIILTNKIFGLVRTGAFEQPYHWEPRSNALGRQDETINIYIKQTPPIEDEIIELTPGENDDSVSEDSEPCIENNLNEINVYYNPIYTDILYDKVKDLNIYHSGHFHWSETSRAHNWIDTSKLIENKENLNFLKNAIVDVLEMKIKPENIDLIIGLGYEGNILATKSAIKHNKPYSFLPYSYRHHEHHKSETELNFENHVANFKNVLIITDVVNDGRTIRKLIKKRQGEFFQNVQKIYVISLFYTGESKINNNILNFDFIKTIPNYDLSSDEEVNNIEYYTVKSLKVEKCPYGKDFRESCLIVKDKLGCVNLFYDESKYIKES